MPNRPPPTPGTVRAAWAERNFRIMWMGSFGSNVGSWMQNAALGAYTYQLSRSPTYVGVVYAAQLGPQLFLGLVGGALGDRVDRRRFLIGAQAGQLAFSALLAALAFGSPSRWSVALVVLGLGVTMALTAPVYSATVPDLVQRVNLPPAISLNSLVLNGSRVIGPMLYPLLLPLVGYGGIFAVNAATFVLVIAALLRVRIPRRERVRGAPVDLLGGLRYARANPVVGRALVTITVFSLLSLPFVGQLPTIAEEALSLDTESILYGAMFCALGLGAMVGAMVAGTALRHVDKRDVVRIGLAGFALSLATLAFMSVAGLAIAVLFVLGVFYFAMITALLTVVQLRTEDRLRGRVMALWGMGFGGTVPIGVLAAGALMERFGVRPVLLVGAVVAAFLVWLCNLRRIEARAARPEHEAVAVC